MLHLTQALQCLLLSWVVFQWKQYFTYIIGYIYEVCVWNIYMPSEMKTKVLCEKYKTQN